MRKSNFYFRFFLLSCGNFIKFVVALKFFRSQLSKREGKKDAMQQQQQQREKKPSIFTPIIHTFYTQTKNPPKQKEGKSEQQTKY